MALAAHPTQARVAACAAADAHARGVRGSSSDWLVRSADAPPFTAFFASGNAGGAGVGGGGDPRALRDRVEAEHVSTLATASATPPPRRARVFYLGDDASVWSVAFAEGPKASRRCALPPPPREVEGAVPARLRVAVTAADASADDASSVAAGKEKALSPTRTRALTKELFLTLSRVPGAEHCSVACVVDGATGAIVARVAARDAVFATTANATETGTLCLAAIAADGASVEARPMSSAAATSSASSFRIDLRALLARVHLSAAVSYTHLTLPTKRIV